MEIQLWYFFIHLYLFEVPSGEMMQKFNKTMTLHSYQYYLWFLLLIGYVKAQVDIQLHISQTAQWLHFPNYLMRLIIGCYWLKVLDGTACEQNPIFVYDYWYLPDFIMVRGWRVISSFFGCVENNVCWHPATKFSCKRILITIENTFTDNFYHLS